MRADRETNTLITTLAPPTWAEVIANKYRH